MQVWEREEEGRERRRRVEGGRERVNSVGRERKEERDGKRDGEREGGGEEGKERKERKGGKDGGTLPHLSCAIMRGRLELMKDSANISSRKMFLFISSIVTPSF